MPKNNQAETTLDKLAEELEAQNPQPSEEKPAEKAETKAEVKAEEESGYKPSEKEKHLYHVELEKPLFDKTTGKKLSKPVVQKFTKAEYNQLVGKKNEKDKSNAEMLGYIVNVLYKPE